MRAAIRANSPKPRPASIPAAAPARTISDCWDSYWAVDQDGRVQDQDAPDRHRARLPRSNYLSTEFRVPVTLLDTNACSPLATNAIGGNIWDNFSSQSYKELPSVGEIIWYHPVTGEPKRYTMPAGGRGYTRPPSLISLWSTAPFLLNNAVGKFNPDPSVDGRISAFNDAIREDALAGTPRSRRGARDESPRHDRPHYHPELSQGRLRLPARQHPRSAGHCRASASVGGRRRRHPTSVRFRPARPSPCSPASISSLRTPTPAASGVRSQGRQADYPHDRGPEEAAAERHRRSGSPVLGSLVDPLLEMSKCPDYVVNRGHYFGTGYTEPGDANPLNEPALSDPDKRALIEFLKTL